MTRKAIIKRCLMIPLACEMLLVVMMNSSAPGQALVQLIPPVQEIQAQRGYTETFTVAVVNVGDDDTPASFSAHDLDITEDGRPLISDGSYPRGCGDWIKLEPEECVIKAHETLTLKASVKVPRDAEGGYYSLIKGSFVGVTIPVEGEKADAKGSAISLESEAMVAVLLTVPSSRNRPVLVPDTLLVFARGENTAHDENKSLDFKSQTGWATVMRVRNEGNIHTRVSGSMSFWTESGSHIDTAPLRAAGRGYLLPGKVRNLTASGKDVLADGYYMIRINVQGTERLGISNSFPFAVYEGKVYPGAVTDELAELIRISAPGLSLKQPFMQKSVTPGGTTYLAVQMANTIDDTLMLIPRQTEWNLNERGQPVLGNDKSLQPRSCSQWIEFADDRVVLPPGRAGSFKLKARSPDDISGEYYTAIIFDPERPRPDSPAEFMAGRTQLIALKVPLELDYAIKMDGPITVNKERSTELTLYRFIFTVRNIGNVHCFATGSMSLEKELSRGAYKSVGRASNFGDTETYLLPGNKRTFEIDIPNLESGTYRIILAVNYKTETQPEVKYQTIKIW